MEEIDLKELFQMFWENKIKIIVITCIALIVGIIYTMFFVTPKYEASTTLLLATNSNTDTTKTVVSTQEEITTTDLTINSKLVSTYSELVKSNRIIRTVISNLGLNVSESYIRSSVTVNAVSDTEVIEISVKNVDPELATKIANEIAKVFIDTIKEFYGIENVHIVDVAEVPTSPCNVNHAKDIVIFVFVGLVLSAGYVFVLTMIDTRLKSPEDIESKTGIPILANFPECNFSDGLKERRRN